MLGSGPATGHSTAPAYVGDGRIEPSRMTGPDLQPNLVANAADTLLTSSKTIRTKGEAVHTAWAGLGASYQEAPEREQLLAVMDPVKTDTDDFGDRLGRVSSAISNFADTMAPLVAKLNAIYEEACAFRQTIDGGVHLSATDPQNPEYKAVMQSSAGAIPDFSHVKATTVSWKEHGPSVDTNTRLLGEYADQYAKLQNAEADCANAITKEVENSCVAPVTKVEAWQLKQPDVKLPWGERVEQKRDCQDGVVYGIGQSGVHLYQGVVSLVAGYNPQKDVYGDWGATGQAWLGLGTLVMGVTKIGDPLAWASRLIPDDAPAGLVQQRDLNIAGQDAVINAAKGIVVADRWKDHPAEAFGETLGNVATFFIPGADVASALKTGSIGARVASIGGHAADFLVPAGSLLLKGGADLALRAGEGVKIAGESIRLGSSALRGSLTDALRNVGDRVPRVEVSWQPASVTPGEVVVPGHLSIDRVESAAAPDAAGGGSGGGGSAGSGSGAEHPPAASHTAVDDAPPRYGERVPGDGAPAAGDDAVAVHDVSPLHHDAPAHDGGNPLAPASQEPGIAGPSTIAGLAPHEFHAQSQAASDGVFHTQLTPQAQALFADAAAKGPGYEHVADVSLTDPGYGEVIVRNPANPPPTSHILGPTDVTEIGNPAIARLIDGNTKFRGSDIHTGQPLDDPGYQDRYVDSAGNTIWPRNDGAAPGTIVQFSSTKALFDYFPELRFLDRLGRASGDYLTARGTVFQERGLTPGHLGYDLHDYDLTGSLPPNVRAEVSVVGPALGQPGGGLQIRFLNVDEGTYISAGRAEREFGILGGHRVR